jgi:predicted porin
MATISAWYTPSNDGIPAAGGTAFVGGDDTGFTGGESAYELGITGSLGVKGLSAHAFMNKADKSDATDSVNDVKGTNYGLSYNMGAVTVGYNYKKTEYAKAASSTIATGETKQNEFGLAYALSPNLTLAANYTKADPSSTLVDAKMKSLAVGYNLGAIALSAQAAKLENYTGTSGVDADVLYLRASTKF